jgi:hypothetical protein
LLVLIAGGFIVPVSDSYFFLWEVPAIEPGSIWVAVERRGGREQPWSLWRDNQCQVETLAKGIPILSPAGVGSAPAHCSLGLIKLVLRKAPLCVQNAAPGWAQGAGLDPGLGPSHIQSSSKSQKPRMVMEVAPA